MSTQIYDNYLNDIKAAQQMQDSQYKALQEAEAQRIRAQATNQINQYNAQKPLLKQTFTDNAQNAYIQKMQSQKELPQVMAAQGYNGGLSESSNIRLDANYGNAYNSYKRAYDNGVRDVDNQIQNANFQTSDLLAQNSNRYNTLLADSSTNYNTMLANAAKEQQAYALQQQQQARTQSTSASTTKPVLTLAQVEKALENGNKSKNVLDAYKYYYGEDYTAPKEEQPTELANAEQRYNYTDSQGTTQQGVRVVVEGYGAVTPDQLNALVQSGKVVRTIKNGKYHYVKG